MPPNSAQPIALVAGWGDDPLQVRRSIIALRAISPVDGSQSQEELHLQKSVVPPIGSSLVSLYIAAVLGGSYAVLVMVIGASNQNLFIGAHGTLGLLFFATVAICAPNIARARHPRLWISLILLLTLLLALTSLSVTSLIGYSPAIIALVVSVGSGVGNK